jgi:uncharacterized protein YgbK (DUF1537 family)
METIIVLDDDPTGTQTVHDVPVITNWQKSTIENEFQLKTPLFFILTNSRALIESEAEELAFTIGKNIKEIGKPALVISRSDSTLRGHFPAEVNALAKGLGYKDDYLIVLAPAFFEGNRFTKDDIHFVKENENWIPIAELPYAKDKTFGYQNSNLRKWVIEKSKGGINEDQIDSVSIQELDSNAGQLILEKIAKTPKVLIVNALDVNHLSIFSAFVKKSKRQIVFRTAASFVPVFGDISSKELLQKDDFNVNNNSSGGLIIVGSHVPKTTAQLNELLKSGINSIEFEVGKYIENPQDYLKSLSDEVNFKLEKKQDLVLFTSRALVSKTSENESLLLSIEVSKGLIFLVQNLRRKPAFLIAKGGITSSDIATKGLNIQRAIVRGQILLGIPVWHADANARFPDLTYVVFPGNVGDDFALLNAYNKFKTSHE